MKLIVYGTLKSNKSANYFLKGAKLLGEVSVKDAEMYTNGSYPMVIKGSEKIKGELWELLDPSLIQRMDRYEGHPILFKRIRVKRLDDKTYQLEIRDQEDSDVYMYIYQDNTEWYKKVENGEW